MAPSSEARLARRYYRNNGIKGACRLAIRVPRQTVWKHISPSGSGAVPGDIVEAETEFCLLWMCVVYKALVISRRLACWCSLSCGSG